MTKNLDVQLVEMYMDMLGLTFLDGRSKLAAKVHPFATRIVNGHIDGDDMNINDSNSNSSSDGWGCRGQGGLWRRSHRSWRHHLFTPNCVSRWPSRCTSLACCRRTEGTYQDAERFTIVDDWSNQSRARATLARPWRVITFFIG